MSGRTSPSLNVDPSALTLDPPSSKKPGMVKRSSLTLQPAARSSVAT
jgi:hypothetical protein